jgi:NTP pyrophosphatase (non-canonical NTP hydrolase)
MAHSTVSESVAADARSGAPRRLSAVICGSFRRDPAGLRAIHRSFVSDGVRILSPQDTEFVHEEDGFVYSASELGDPPQAVEARHLDAMTAADFIWLHTPEGYVGPSAALEIGFAHALGLSVYAGEPPRDVVIRDLVNVVRTPSDAISASTQGPPVADAPTRSLQVLQHYYHRAATDRGWSDETPQESLLLLGEEVGELSRAVRKTRNGLVHVAGEDPALELADVALYVVHLANVLDIDLAAAVAAKESINAERFQARTAREAA